MSERRMNSFIILVFSCHEKEKKKGIGRRGYLSNITTDLAYLRQELQSCHPFRGAQSSLPCKIVEMRNETLEDIFQPCVLAEGIDPYHVLGDVVHR